MYSFYITTQVLCIFYLREVMIAASGGDAQKFDHWKKIIFWNSRINFYN